MSKINFDSLIFILAISRARSISSALASPSFCNIERRDESRKKINEECNYFYKKAKLTAINFFIMVIREAINKDLDIILEIMNDAIVNTTSIYDYKMRNQEFIEDWFNKKCIDKMPVLVCEINKKTVAFGTYGMFRTREAYKFSVEHSIYVHKNSQGQGIGKQLLASLITKAKNDGYHTMIAGIDSLNQKSIDFHKKFGFIEVGKIKEVGYKFNLWLDLIFLQLLL